MLGKTGEDQIKAGKGSDVFIYNSLREGGDTIIKFAPEDLFDFRRIFNGSKYAAATPAMQLEQYIKIGQVGKDSQILVDEDGSGNSTDFTLIATLKGYQGNLASTNFII